MDLLIVTGLSGAGKSLAVHALEDMGYFCIDNIPAGLLASFARLTLQQQVELGKVAMVLDSRGCRSAEALQNGLDQLRGMEMEFRILFLDASDEVLERRYQETRRRHPLSLALELSTEQAIQMERQIMAPLFERADYVKFAKYVATNEENASAVPLAVRFVTTTYQAEVNADETAVAVSEASRTGAYVDGALRQTSASSPGSVDGEAYSGGRSLPGTVGASDRTDGPAAGNGTGREADTVTPDKKEN